jgi:hypothetical protein
MTREALDALEAWHSTTKALRDATPWTSEWVRLRMIAQEQREAYEALIDDRAQTDEADQPVPAASEAR